MSDVSRAPRPLFPASPFDLAVIGTSLGGRAVLSELLAPLPADFPIPLLVVQHVGGQRSVLPALLGQGTRLRVRHAADGERLCAGTVYVAPPDHHLLVSSAGTCRLSSDARVHFARPAADPLFHSAAQVVGCRAIGIVLTGRLSDGAAGALAIKAAGGIVLAQAPETCVAPEMPQSSIDANAVDFVLPPNALAAALVSLATMPGVAMLFGVRRGRFAA